MKHSYELVLDNISLKPLCSDDIELLRKWRNDSSNTKFLKKIPFISKEKQISWFNSYLSNSDELCFGIHEIAINNRLVGSCSLYNFSEDSCFFGKLLIGEKTAHGKNLGRNATNAAVKIAFECLKLKCVFLYVYEDNIGAIKVYKECGFNVCSKQVLSNGKTEYLMVTYK